MWNKLDMTYIIFIIVFYFYFCGLGFSYLYSNSRFNTCHQVSNPYLLYLAIGFGFEISYLGICGVLISIVDYQFRKELSILLLVLPFILFVYKFIENIHNEHKKYNFYFIFWSVSFLFYVFTSFSIAILPVKLPNELRDGPYVIKQDLLNVRIQFITGDMPADNVIPHVVSEYLLRDISFKSNRPILPGQEITNRPILASLIIVPFQCAIKLPKKIGDRLPTFTYLGIKWPDYSVLLQDQSAYKISLIIGILLNSLFLIIVGFLASKLLNNKLLNLLLFLLILSSPYFIIETIFVWPKLAAAAMIFCSYVFYNYKINNWFVGFFGGLAYLFHPYAIVYVFSYIVFLLVGTSFNFIKRDKSLAIKNFIFLFKFLSGFCVVTLPWWIFSFSLGIKSNLASQNFFIPGQSLVDFTWVRLVNLFNMIVPAQLERYPFDPKAVYLLSHFNIFGAIGSFVLFVVLFRSFPTHLNRFTLILWGLPALLIVLVFSNVAVPLLHGMQPLVALMLVLCVESLSSKEINLVGYSVICSQIAFNVLVATLYFSKTFLV